MVRGGFRIVRIAYDHSFIKKQTGFEGFGEFRPCLCWKIDHDMRVQPRLGADTTQVGDNVCKFSDAIAPVHEFEYSWGR